MSLGIRVSAAGAAGTSARIDALAHNLANAATPGFRRAEPSFRTELDGALRLDAPRLDARGGSYEATGRSLDLALQTPGWFAVRDLSSNETRYTRAGNFALAGDGRLTTAEGRGEVLGTDGLGIAVDPSAGAIRTGSDGRLFQGDVAIGQLGIWGIGDETRLQSAGEGLYRNGGSDISLAAEARVSPGTLERSSVDPVSEMVGLLRAFRALEANLEAMRLQDGALGRAIDSAARPREVSEMLRALSCAASGGRALLARIDLHANNLANAETAGFKRSRAEFADLLSQKIDGAQFGSGVRLVSTSAVQEQGALRLTGRPLDLAVEGEGHFRVVHPETGDVRYTRAGHFVTDAQGRLATPDGWRLDPGVSAPKPGAPLDLAAIRLVRFDDPSALRAQGSNLLEAVPAAGDAVEFAGSVRAGALEQSNVDVLRELTDLIAAHRAFEINGKVIEAADEALRSVSSLRSARS